MAAIQKPAGSPWTDEQWQAITERGRNLLVAAAAGSGKTAVLVERIIRTVSDEAHPIDIDRLLVATFTSAAAAEMRHRLRGALEKALAENPQSRHLRRQLALVGRASITTLHSFCLDVVRRYTHLTELDPAFRIANETEAALLRQEAVEGVFEERYGSSEDGSAFWQLADRFGGERGDEALYRLVERLYDFSRSHPFPEQWLKAAAQSFRLESDAALGDAHPWLRSLEGDVRLELQSVLADLSRASALAMLPLGPAVYEGNLAEDAAGVSALLKALEDGGWRGLETAVRSGADAVAFAKLKPQRGEVDAVLLAQVKELRKSAKERVAALKEQLLTRTLAEYARECGTLAPMMEELVELVGRFAAEYRSLKAAKGLVDFNDLEHACLHILRDPSSTPERLVPTEAAKQYREQFAEVYVDEYQDTNAVQETILRLVSRGGTADEAAGNRFMVGDVKQSIYRFRLAEPGLFLEKYKTYAAVSETGGSGVRIDLARNFRSRREVVDAVNYIFRQTMHEEAAELEYDERAELVNGAVYPAHSGPHLMVPEVLLVDRRPLDDEGEDPVDGFDDVDDAGSGAEALKEEEVADLDAAELEARTIGRRIAELTGAAGLTPMEVWDKDIGAARPIAFRDIVILLRADKAWAPAFIEQLRSFGIPAYAELGGGYFEAAEVQTMIALLQTIDNPLQDIPLAATLRAPFFGFTSDELARIRAIGGRGRPFYDCVGAAAAQDGDLAPENEAVRNKAARFLMTLEPWRTAARQSTLAELLLRLYRETGYADYVGGLPGGSARQANLKSMYDRARQYEATSFRGLFRFLRFIERLRDTGADLGAARVLGEKEDVVRIMSVHKSKGLEFPVVFVAGLGKMFNRGDEREPFLIHKELGFGPRFVEPEPGVAYPTLPQLAIRRRLRAETLAEEMRVLYVALTRAKEKLLLVGSSNALRRKLEAWEAASSEPGPRLPAHVIHRGASFLDWIMPALLRHPACDAIRAQYGLSGRHGEGDGASWFVGAVKPDALRQAAAARQSAERREAAAVAAAVPVPDEWTDRDHEVARMLGWSDPRPAASVLYAKTSVTEWKRRLQEEESVWLGGGEPSLAYESAEPGDGVGSGRPPMKRPRFIERRGLTPIERGVAYHAVMQHLPLRPGQSLGDVEAFIDELAGRQLLSEEQRSAIDAAAVLRFLDSEAGERLLQAKHVRRELPFSVGLPAVDVYGRSSDGVEIDLETASELVLVQGIVDCLFETEDGRLVLIDFKTDRMYEGRLEALTERYRIQLAVYAKAVAMSLGRPVADKYLYFFDGSTLVKV